MEGWDREVDVSSNFTNVYTSLRLSGDLNTVRCPSRDNTHGRLGLSRSLVILHYTKYLGWLGTADLSHLLDVI